MKAGQTKLFAYRGRVAWGKVRAIALRRLDEVARAQANIARRDKPGDLHDFRVASRRLEQALDLLRSAEMRLGVRRLQRRLARARKSISDVRNYDVFLDRLDKILVRPKAPQREAWRAVRDYLEKKRARKHNKAARKFAKLNLPRTCAGLRSALKSNQRFAGKRSRVSKTSTAAAPPPGGFCELAAAEAERLWEAVEEANRDARDSSDASAIHALRLAVKRLRYLMEIIDTVEVPVNGNELSSLRGAQRRLGEWHDLEMGERLLAQMAGRPKFVHRQPRLARDILKLMTQSRQARGRILSRRPVVIDPATRAHLERSVNDLQTAAVKLKRRQHQH
ncbi:MAG: CHAD domain-containing protein [Terriglobia bacterium]